MYALCNNLPKRYLHGIPPVIAHEIGRCCRFMQKQKRTDDHPSTREWIGGVKHKDDFLLGTKPSWAALA